MFEINSFFARPLFGLALLFGASSCTLPKSSRVTDPISHLFAATPNLTPAIGAQGVTLDLPQNASGLTWHMVQAGHYPGNWARWVPQGQTLTNWQEVITARALPPFLLPSDVVQLRMQNLTKSCTTLHVISFSAVQSSGGFDTLMSCAHAPPPVKKEDAKPPVKVGVKPGTKPVVPPAPPAVPTQYEAVWLRGVFSPKGNFLIERDWRGKERDRDPTGENKSVLAAWQSWFSRTGITGEHHEAIRRENGE